MSVKQQRDFEQRMQRINRHHRKLSRGFVASVNSDGLIVARPRAFSIGFPWRGLLFVLVVLLGLKVALFATMGEAEYTATVDRLKAGTMAEQIGGYAMAADPATVWLAQQVLAFDP